MGGTDDWLPGKGSNLDYLDQNQMCYHYTTGQFMEVYRGEEIAVKTPTEKIVKLLDIR